MTTATGLTCVDYLSPKFNIHTFQDTDYSLSKRDIYDYNFQHLSTYLNERNSFTNRNVGNTSAKGLNFTQQSCLQELRCNFTKLNLAEKFIQSCGQFATLTPQLEQDACGGTAATNTGNTDTTSRNDTLSCDNGDHLFTDSFSYDEPQYGTPGYSHKCTEKLLHDSDSCDTDDDEIAGYIFNNKKTDALSSRDFGNFRDAPESTKEFRTINDFNESPVSDVTDEDYSDSEIELAMITSGAFNTNPLTKQSRKRSSDCLQEYDIKRPCIDVEKMHLSLSNSLSPVAYHEKQLFVPIDVVQVN